MQKKLLIDFLGKRLWCQGSQSLFKLCARIYCDFTSGTDEMGKEGQGDAVGDWGKCVVFEAYPKATEVTVSLS